ncbi:MAG: hypothetical protein V4655_06355, partial [Bdellovibrionota bacterium]
MLKRWNVHHGNQDLGLMTAKEIRGALRKGTLDPFDKVSAEGSNIREDLIEVDEIFAGPEDEGEGTASHQSMPSTSAKTSDGSSPVAMPDKAQPSAFSQALSQAALPPSAFSASAPSVVNRPSPSPMQGNYESEEYPRTNPPPSASAFSSMSWKGSGDATSVAALKDDSKSTQKRYYLIDKAKILGPVSALEIQSLFNRGGINAKVKVQKIGGS